MRAIGFQRKTGGTDGDGWTSVDDDNSAIDNLDTEFSLSPTSCFAAPATNTATNPQPESNHHHSVTSQTPYTLPPSTGLRRRTTTTTTTNEPTSHTTTTVPTRTTYRRNDPPEGTTTTNGTPSLHQSQSLFQVLLCMQVHATHPQYVSSPNIVDGGGSGGGWVIVL